MLGGGGACVCECVCVCVRACVLTLTMLCMHPEEMTVILLFLCRVSAT